MEFKNVNVELPGQHLKPHLNWLWGSNRKILVFLEFFTLSTFLKFLKV